LFTTAALLRSRRTRELYGRRGTHHDLLRRDRHAGEEHLLHAVHDHEVLEVQAVREIIKGVNPGITEQIKWNAPSFSYAGYMATFNLWAKGHVHLIFHNGAILNDNGGLLEGNYPDRRMVYFSSMEDVKAKRAALEDLIRQWIELMDRQEVKS
jgi:hypothetical protein